MKPTYINPKNEDGCVNHAVIDTLGRGQKAIISHSGQKFQTFTQEQVLNSFAAFERQTGNVLCEEAKDIILKAFVCCGYTPERLENELRKGRTRTHDNT